MLFKILLIPLFDCEQPIGIFRVWRITSIVTFAKRIADLIIKYGLRTPLAFYELKNVRDFTHFSFDFSSGDLFVLFGLELSSQVLNSLFVKVALHDHFASERVNG